MAETLTQETAASADNQTDSDVIWEIAQQETQILCRFFQGSWVRNVFWRRLNIVASSFLDLGAVFFGQTHETPAIHSFASPYVLETRPIGVTTVIDGWVCPSTPFGVCQVCARL